MLSSSPGLPAGSVLRFVQRRRLGVALISFAHGSDAAHGIAVPSSSSGLKRLKLKLSNSKLSQTIHTCTKGRSLGVSVSRAIFITRGTHVTHGIAVRARCAEARVAFPWRSPWRASDLWATSLVVHYQLDKLSKKVDRWKYRNNVGSDWQNRHHPCSPGYKKMSTKRGKLIIIPSISN